MDTATNDEVASVFAHLPDPLHTWQRLWGKLSLQDILVVAARAGGRFAAPVAWERTRRAGARGALPEALPLDLFLLRPAFLVDGRTGIVAKGQVGPDRRVRHMFDRVVVVQVLWSGGFV